MKIWDSVYVSVTLVTLVWVKFEGTYYMMGVSSWFKGQCRFAQICQIVKRTSDQRFIGIAVASVFTSRFGCRLYCHWRRITLCHLRRSIATSLEKMSIRNQAWANITLLANPLNTMLGMHVAKRTSFPVTLATLDTHGIFLNMGHTWYVFPPCLGFQSWTPFSNSGWTPMALTYITTGYTILTTYLNVL